MSTTRRTSSTSSSAPGSPASAPRSSSRRTASATSWSSRRAPTSAAPGATTPTPARRATSRASSTRSPSRPTPTGRSSYSPQPEIQAYIQRVAERVRHARPVRLRHRRRRRRLGRRRPALARCGSPARRRAHRHRDHADPRRRRPLRAEAARRSRASTTFQGEVFHSARWDHDVDLTGKRVAVIGTGASAIQIVPELQQVVAGHLDVYQRTAPWVIPRNDRTYGAPRAARCSAACRRCSRLYRTGIYWAHEGYVPGVHARSRSSPRRPRRPAAGEHRQGDQGPRAAREGHPALRDRLQADAALQHLLPRARRRQRRAGHRPDRQGHRRRDRHRRRRRARRSTCSSSPPASTRPSCRSPSTSRAAPARTLADTWRDERHGGLQGHDRPRLPQPVHDRRPQHRPGPHQHGLHHRVAGRLHPRRGPHDAARRATPRSSRRAERTRRVERRPPAPDEAHRVDHRRLPELVPRRARQQHRRSGPKSTFTFRRQLAEFDVDAYDVRRPTSPRREPGRAPHEVASTTRSS